MVATLAIQQKNFMGQHVVHSKNPDSVTVLRCLQNVFLHTTPMLRLYYLFPFCLV